MNQNNDQLKESLESNTIRELSVEELSQVVGAGGITVGSGSAPSPSVTLTPSAGGAVPIPYPNIGQSGASGTGGAVTSISYGGVISIAAGGPSTTAGIYHGGGGYHS